MPTQRHLVLSSIIGGLLLSVAGMVVSGFTLAEVNPSALQKSSEVKDAPKADAAAKVPGAISTGIKVGVIIEKIEAIHSAEKSGDELYFSIAQYSNVEKPKILNMPEPPMHWLSKYIDKVKDVVVWTKPIVDQEKVNLSLSLVEMDNPPWNPDDLLGVFDLQLLNNKGKIEINWDEPKKENAIDADQKGSLSLNTAQTIEVKGDSSDYKITFKIKIVE